MREIKTIAYEAFDGTVFENEQDCVDYEQKNMKNALKGVIFKNEMLTVLTLDEVRQDPNEVFYFKTLNQKQFELVESLISLREYIVASEGLEMIYLLDRDAWYHYSEYVADCEDKLAQARKWGE